MNFIVRLGSVFLNVLYFFYKFIPCRKQIAFISRQSDVISMDFFLLKKKLKESAPEIKIVEQYKMIPQTVVGQIKYLFYLIGPLMYTLATSKVVVLDGYSVAVSVLKHKKSLKIVQMWHAMGSLKRFGYTAVDTKEGSKRKTAEIFRMHKNYDYILASSEVCIKPLAESFGNSPDKFIVFSLPRTDLITNIEFMEQKRKQIIKDYPEIKDKKNILYAPTFRKNADMIQAVRALIDCVDYEKYNLIIKLHPLVKSHVESLQALSIDKYNSLELLSVADYVVTDYSAFIFEAALARLPIFLYAFDYKEYNESRGFLIDYTNEMPGDICISAESVINNIEMTDFNLDRVERFANKYITCQEKCTEKLTSFLIRLCQS